jgi:hypothetical protein
LPLRATSIMLGDRIGVTSVAIQNGQIMVELLTRGAGDAIADAPTVPEIQTYQLNLQLEQAGAE